MTTPGPGTSPSAALSRFTGAELVVGAGCLALLVSLLLPWKSDGFTTHHSWSGVGLLTILLGLLISAWFVARSPWLRNTVSIRSRTMSDSVVFIAGGIAEAVTVLIYTSEHSGGSVQLGWVLALLAGLATATGGYLMHTRRSASPPAPTTATAPALDLTDPVAPPATGSTDPSPAVAPQVSDGPADRPGIV